MITVDMIRGSVEWASKLLNRKICTLMGYKMISTSGTNQLANNNRPHTTSMDFRTTKKYPEANNAARKLPGLVEGSGAPDWVKCKKKSRPKNK